MMLFASLISRILDPFIGFIFLFGFAAFRSGVFGWDLIALMSLIFITMILPLGLLLLWAVKTKRVANWDISNRRERVRAFVVLAFFLCIDYVIMQTVGTPYMNQVFRFFLMLYFGFFLITLRWKLSGHMSTISLVALFFTYWYGGIFFLLFTLIPLVAWSRLILKRHTMGEIIGGTAYTFFVFFLARALHLI